MTRSARCWHAVCIAVLLPTTITACSGDGSAHSLIHGRLLAEFGPGPKVRPHPLQGTLRVTDLATGHVTVVKVSEENGYSLTLRPGRYRIRGTSPDWDHGHGGCSTSYPVIHIAGDETKLVDVLCLGI